MNRSTRKYESEGGTMGADVAEGRREQTTIGAKMMGGEIGRRGKKNLWAMVKLGVRSGENPGKCTNEPERRKLGSMRNALFRFGLGRESVADRGLTRCSSKMQQRITDSSVVRGQLSVEPGYRPVSVVSCQLSVVSCREAGKRAA